MDIRHKQILTGIVARLETDGAPHDVGIALHQTAAVGEHTVRIIEMPEQVVVDLARCLLHTQQDVVYAQHCALQRLLSIVHRLLAQGFVGDVEYRAQCHSQQQRQSTENQPISFNKLFHYDVSVVDKESR